jgi:nicotinamide-nucleotide amidase
MRMIEERFRKIRRTMSEVNARQAMVPEGATVLANDRGTAPGLWLEVGGRIVILLPGPPHELKAMFSLQVESRLARLSTGIRLVARELRVAGMGESDVDQRIAPIYTRHGDVQTTILTAPGEIQIHLRAWTTDPPAAERQLQGIQESIVLTLGEAVFTVNGESMEEVVARELTMHHATIATAESCTGGLLAERLTRVSGSSAYFLGGVVSYSNSLKSAWVDVPAEIIESRGAVSSEVAVALADGIRRRTGATLGVGITGVAGPTGGTPEKPVGTVHVAIADSSGSKERGALYPGERDRIRWQASQTALDLVRRYFLYASQPKSGS